MNETEVHEYSFVQQCRRPGCKPADSITGGWTYSCSSALKIGHWASFNVHPSRMRSCSGGRRITSDLVQHALVLFDFVVRALAYKLQCNRPALSAAKDNQLPVLLVVWGREGDGDGLHTPSSTSKTG